MEIALSVLVFLLALAFIGGWAYFHVVETRRIKDLIRELMRCVLARDRDGLYSTLPPSGFRHVSFFKQQARLQQVQFHEELEEMLDQAREFPSDLSVRIAQIMPTGWGSGFSRLLIRSRRAGISSELKLPLIKEKGEWYVKWYSGLARRLSRALGTEPEVVKEEHQLPKDYMWRD